MRTVAAGVVLLLVAVSGCSSDEAAPAEVGPVASGSSGAPSVSTSADAAPPTATRAEPAVTQSARAEHPLPSDASAPDAAGASAFARHYFDVMNEALASGNAEGLDELSDPGCGGCSNILTAIANASRVGHSVRDAELRVDFAEAPAVTSGETIVDLRYERAAGEVVDGSGDTVERIPREGPVDTQMRLRYTQGSWSVLGFRRVST